MDSAEIREMSYGWKQGNTENHERRDMFDKPLFTDCRRKTGTGTQKCLRVLQGPTLGEGGEEGKLPLLHTVLKNRRAVKITECSPGSAPTFPFPQELSSQHLEVQHPLPCFEQGSAEQPMLTVRNTTSKRGSATGE